MEGSSSISKALPMPISDVARRPFSISATEARSLRGRRAPSQRSSSISICASAEVCLSLRAPNSGKPARRWPKRWRASRPTSSRSPDRKQASGQLPRSDFTAETQRTQRRAFLGALCVSAVKLFSWALLWLSESPQEEFGIDRQRWG